MSTLNSETAWNVGLFAFSVHRQSSSNENNFFKRQHLYVNTFAKMVKNSSVRETVCGTGTKNWSITHGSRGTLALVHFVSDHSDSSVSLWTVRRD